LTNRFKFRGQIDAVEETEEEWDDPWIDACKAILAILKQNPRAAGQRESRHGCLPLHLACYAMCPTPDVEALRQKYSLQDSVYASVDHDVQVQGMKNIRNGATVTSKTTFLPSPLRSKADHGYSHSSGGSSVGTNSLDDFSAAMERELPMRTEMNMNASQSQVSTLSNANSVNRDRDRDLSHTLEKLEAQLRSAPQSKLSDHDEAVMLESARLLSTEMTVKGNGIPRPTPLGTFSASAESSDVYRSTSIGSQTSTCSNSVMSAASFASTIYSQGQSPRATSFNLKKYVTNEARREEYSLRVINALIEAYPRGVKVDSEGGRLPLHTAVAGKATLRVIETITRAYLPACRHRIKGNSLPLHIAAFHGVSHPGVADMLLEVYPDAIVGKNQWERTPFEEAFMLGGYNGRIYQEELCRALRPPAWFGKPFHMRKGYALHGDIEQLLNGEFKGNGSAGNKRNPQNEEINTFDIFSLIKNRRWDDIVDNIEALESQASKRTKCEVRAGYITHVSPLYLACEQEPTYEVLDALVNACPVATTWRILPGGELPIHAACTYGASNEAVGFLLAASPDTAMQRDKFGNLALHSACYSGASKSIINSLLCTNPKAADSRNMNGSTPRDIVKSHSHPHPNSNEIFNLIEQTSLEMLKKKRQIDAHQEESNDGRLWI
jgi:hypothetical protein